MIKKKLETLCKLQKERAIQIIENTETVMCRHGVWNPYYENKTHDVIESIKRSGYGADVFIDTATGVYYVSIPCASDMW